MVEVPELMTVKQLQEYMGIGHDLAYDLVKDRKFPSFKVGNKWLIDANKLYGWMEAQSKQNYER